MKRTRDITPFIIIGVIVIFLGVWFTHRSTQHNQFEVGQTWERVMFEDDPFEPNDTVYYTILDIKDDYILYEKVSGYGWVDTSSASIRYFIVMDFKLKE